MLFSIRKNKIQKNLSKSHETEKEKKIFALTSVSVEGLAELVNAGGNLQALLEDGPLALNADVLGPLDEATEIPLGLDGATDGEVLGGLLNEGVQPLLDLLLGDLGLECGGKGGNLLALANLALTLAGGRLGGGSSGGSLGSSGGLLVTSGLLVSGLGSGGLLGASGSGGGLGGSGLGSGGRSSGLGGLIYKNNSNPGG